MHGRLEVLAAPHQQVVALAEERNEVEPVHPGHGFHRETGIGAPFEHVKGNIRLGAGGRIEHRDRVRLDARLGEQVQKQEMAARLGLAGDEPDSGEVRGARETSRVAARNHQALGTPRPFDHHHGLARELAGDEAQIELPGIGIEYVHAGRERLAVREPRESVDAAAEEGGDFRARLADRPVEQRIVAPREHRRRRSEIGRARGELDPAPNPRFDEIAREQHLPRHPAHRDRLLRDELVDLALLDPEEIGDFPGGEERIHEDRRCRTRCGERRRRETPCEEPIIGRS